MLFRRTFSSSGAAATALGDYLGNAAGRAGAITATGIRTCGSHDPRALPNADLLNGSVFDKCDAGQSSAEPLVTAMRKFVHRIKKELQTAKHCAVYEDELNRVWPSDGERRESEIARFAQDHEWRLRYYRATTFDF